MTAKEIQKRNIKADQLKVMQSEDGQFFVESSKGKILYYVILNGDEKSCTCGDFAKNHKQDPAFKCKHILSVENAAPNGDIEPTKFLEKNTPKLKEEFITDIKGKQFVLYAGVLDLATQKGLLKLEVELIQYPTKENGREAICRAVAEGKNGEVFSDIGDANPNNCTEKIVKHLIRMASTRAKGRALRDMCNISIACLEELESMDDVMGSDSPKSTRKTAPKTPPASAMRKTPEEKQAPAVTGKAPEENKPGTETAPPPAEKVNSKEKDKPPKAAKEKDNTVQDAPLMSEAQKRAIHNLSRRRGVSDQRQLFFPSDDN
jgi:predicted nucleic acid-binding Zn finger protein